MSNGKVEQMAAPIEAYKRPASPFVADFLGQANLIRVHGSDAGAAFSGGTIPGLALPAGGQSLISIRPEDILVTADESGPVKADIVFIREMGSTIEIHLDAGSERIVALAPPKSHCDLRVGTSVSLTLPAEACVVFGADGAS
jgi:putative spermidine/putrescine transport system ATP-binding protein